MVNLRELKQLILDKYVVVQKHPEHDLYIYNYSQKTQYERYWTPLTLMCRGLILDGERNVVSRGLNKFFNREELNGDEIPNEPFEVFEKYDGSYINVFRYNGEIIVSSRGSFTSDQAIYTRQLINEKYPCFESHMVNNTSYIFELIADWNRIVVNYGGENKLVLLTAFDTSRKRGTELDFNDVLDWADTLECDVAKRYNFSDYETLKEKIGNNQEGFVVRFENGFRMKIKGSEYVRLHRIVTQISSKTIWKALKDGGDSFQEMIENVPDEFMDFVKEQVGKFEIQYINIGMQAYDAFYYIRSTYDISDRKVFAEQATKFGSLSGLLLAIYDGKDISPSIWGRIEPEFEQPFKDKISAKI